jgi:MFS family permease
MPTKRETNVVYGAGVVQGIVLVTFPAASTIFTDPDEYDLSNTQYGLLFVPQVVTAIAASLLGAWLGRRFSTKRVYVAGLVASFTSMALLIVSTFFESNTSAAVPLLLLATAFLVSNRQRDVADRDPRGGDCRLLRHRPDLRSDRPSVLRCSDR